MFKWLSYLRSHPTFTTLLHDTQAGKSTQFVHEETKDQREERTCLSSLAAELGLESMAPDLHQQLYLAPVLGPGFTYTADLHIAILHAQREAKERGKVK